MLRMKWLIVAGLTLSAAVLACAACWAQVPEGADFTAIDKYADNAPADVGASVDTLADYLTRNATTDLDKSRAVYRWIIRNIGYDVDNYMAGTVPDDAPAVTLANRITLCGGYAKLFEALCKRAKVEAMYLEGYSRGADYSVGAKLEAYPDHAWNAVKIDGKWYLLDATWASGYIDGNNQFVRQAFDHYFLTTPTQFYYDHLPEEPKWQLVDKPISKSEYEKLVYLRPGFFRNNLQVKSNKDAVVKSVGKSEIVFGAPENVMVTAEVLRGKIKDSSASTMVVRQDGGLKLNTVYPKIGSYTLRLFARGSKDEAFFEWAADYLVEVSAIEGDTSSFPKMYSTFYDRKANLIAPMTGTLKSGQKQTFRITAPGAEAVSAIVDGKWEEFTKDGDSFTGEVDVRGQTIQVAAKFPGSDSYYVLLKYIVS